ncbi:MAG: hypothetical protein R6U58_10960 [Bacteroidales bacterium]
MKKAILLFAVLFYLTSSSFAGSKDIFSIDRQAIDTELSDLNELEAHVKSTSATLSGLETAGSPLVSNVTNSNSIMNMSIMGEPPLGISSFIWGFCLGVPGLAIVYFVTEDSDETKKALWGCLAGGAIYVVLYVVYVAVLVGTTTAYY